MPHAIGANHPLRGYETEAVGGAIITACAAIANPVLGAALGVYFVTDITTNLIADHFRWGESNPLARVIRVALTVIASLGAAFATFSALMGTAIALTPGAMGLGISLLCLSVLASLFTQD